MAPRNVRIISDVAVLMALLVAGCRHTAPRNFPAVLRARTPDQGRCGPRYYDQYCGYRPSLREGEADRLEFTCWQKPHEFYCEGCPREERLTCRLELPAEGKVGQPLLLKVRLANTSKTTLRIDPYYTPLGHDVGTATFHMHCDGNDEPHTGGIETRGFRGKPDFARYLTIPPGGVIESEIDLHRSFAWMRGACVVHWHGMLWDVIDADHPRAKDAPENRVAVDCNWAVTRVEP